MSDTDTADAPRLVGHVHPKVRDLGVSVPFYRVAFEVGSRAALAAVHDRARERGVRISPVDHGISKALCFDDPDGNGAEVYLDTREETDRPTPTGTRGTRPRGPRGPARSVPLSEGGHESERRPG